jgi:hypothetical protein
MLAIAKYVTVTIIPPCQYFTDARHVVLYSSTCSRGFGTWKNNVPETGRNDVDVHNELCFTREVV